MQQRRAPAVHPAAPSEQIVTSIGAAALSVLVRAVHALTPVIATSTGSIYRIPYGFLMRRRE
jgi:hypothetical protein